MAFWVEAEFAAGDPAAGDPAADAFAPAQIGAVSLPMPGQDVCGDGWAVTGTRRMVCSVVDGLGHGPDAATAARASLDVLRDHAEVAPGRMLELAHQRTRPTRGAAVAFAVLERSEVAAPGHFEQVSASASRNLLFAGVGNIAASVVDGELRRQQLISHNGIVGHNLRKVQQVGARLDAGDLLVMHSDGLSSNWDLASYPGLSARHPALIAAVLYRDFNRGTDDVTILVVRCAA
jgi:serine/threonine protein phosphatase PrpC